MRISRGRIIQALVLAIVLGAAWLQSTREHAGDEAARRESSAGGVELTPGRIEGAFERGQSNVLVTERGRIVRLLEDDRDGARHQRFIVELDSGITVLIAHNVDLAPRVPDLRVGRLIVFRGEYEWNDRGGVVHWTHHDPEGVHEDGWLEYAGRRYQ
jgi:hypothetical protein